MTYKKIVAILGAVAALATAAAAVVTSLHDKALGPSASGGSVAVQSSPMSAGAITGTQNAVIQVQGNNNVVAPASSRSPEMDDPDRWMDTLETGVTRAFIEKHFGIARHEQHDEASGMVNLEFAFPHYLLQVVVDRQNTVLFYSVVTRTKGFTPKVPYFDAALLGARFASYGESELVYSRASSKFYEYVERHYLGNPGNYHNLYVGYCPAGFGDASLPGSSAPVFDDRPEAIAQFRAAASPNCFGVGASLGDETALLEAFGMGFDYFEARELRN